jgi:hypothetical protein
MTEMDPSMAPTHTASFRTSRHEIQSFTSSDMAVSSKTLGLYSISNVVSLKTLAQHAQKTYSTDATLFNPSLDASRQVFVVDEEIIRRLRVEEVIDDLRKASSFQVDGQKNWIQRRCFVEEFDLNLCHFLGEELGPHQVSHWLCLKLNSSLPKRSFILRESL